MPSFDVVSDLICPWCFIGKRRLDQVLASPAGADVIPRWRPFQLYPQLPMEGLDRATFMRARFGEDAANRGTPQVILDEARGAGIELNYGAVTRVPNTLHGHRLIDWVGPGPQRRGAVIRPYLASIQRQRDPHTAVNDRDWQARGPVVVVNGRWVPPSGFVPPDAPRSWLGLCDGQPACALVGPEDAVGLEPNGVDYWFETLAARRRGVELGGEWITRPWDIVAINADHVAPGVFRFHTHVLELPPLARRHTLDLSIIARNARGDASTEYAQIVIR